MTWTALFRIASSLVIVAILTSASHAQTFSNTTPIIIGNGTNNPAGPASPFPSVINVSGFSGPGTITEFTVQLNGFTHAFPQDLAVIIVGPNTGQKTLLFNGPSSSNTSGVNLTFNDNATEQLPIAGPIVSGTYQPGLNRFPASPIVFSAPAPAGPYSTTFGSTGTPLGNAPFIGATNPNGDYSLYVEDFADGDGGSIDSWSISITYTPVPEPSSILLGAAGLGLVGTALRRRWRAKRV